MQWPRSSTVPAVTAMRTVRSGRGYSHVAPVSWLVAHDVTDGREAVNFSEWGAYESVKQAKLLKEACDEVKEGAMPPRIYTWMHPDAKLTGQDVETICQVAAQP